MRHIQKRVRVRHASVYRQIFSRLFAPISAGLPARNMAIFMILVNRPRHKRHVHNRHPPRARILDQPLIEPRTAQNQLGHFCKCARRKHKQIDRRRIARCALRQNFSSQFFFASTGKIERFLYIDIQPMRDRKKFRECFMNHTHRVHKFLQKNNIAVDVAQQRSLRKTSRSSQKIVQHRRPKFISRDFRLVSHTKTRSRLGNPVFCPE